MPRPRQPQHGVSPRSKVKHTGTVTPHVHTNHGANLWKLCRKLAFSPKKVAEIGVMLPENCEVQPFINEGVLVDLFEPQPEAAAALRRKWGDLDTVSIHEVALADYSGTAQLARRLPDHVTGAAYLELPNEFKNTTAQAGQCHITVKVSPFSQFDDGDYDLITMDTEGSEWMIIRDMVSRPKVLSVEVKHREWWARSLEAIMRWAEHNGYGRHIDHNLDRIFIRE